MSVINIKNLVRRFHGGAAAWPWTYNPFVELASKTRTEIAISKKGHSLYRKSWLNQSIQKQIANPSLETLTAVCHTIKSGESVVLSIDEEMCFVHHLEVPSIAMKKINSVLDFELTKTTPFAKGQVYMGWKSQNSKSNPDVQHITQYVIRRDFFAECIQALSSRGAKVQAIIIRQRDGFCVPFALSASGEDFAKDHAQLWSRAAFISAGAMALFALCFIGAIMFSHSKVLTFINTNTDKYEEDAVLVRKQLDVLSATHSEISALIKKSSTSVKKSLVIEEISKILTDDSYLDGISISGDVVTIDGASANPEGLIAVLEASPLFKGVTFNTPSFRNPGEEKSRFSIKLNTTADGA